MNVRTMLTVLCLSLVTHFTELRAAQTGPGPSNGVQYPTGWRHWQLLGVSQRSDNGTLRAILGNEVAAEAARDGITNPWPDGTMIGKVVWKEEPMAEWPAAAVPGTLVHVEFMVKDGERRAGGGWAWARWVGLEQAPFNKGMQVCVDCHAPVQGRDWVFTRPAALPN